MRNKCEHEVRREYEEVARVDQPEIVMEYLVCEKCDEEDQDILFDWYDDPKAGEDYDYYAFNS